MATSVSRVRTDDEIKQDLLDELTWDMRVQPHEIGVIVKDGIATLTGTVDSYTKRWAAEEAAHRVRGAKAVANEIEVRLPGSAERDDSDIAAAAVRALQWDTLIPMGSLDLTVSKGWVTLQGEVDWHYQKDDSEQVIRRLAGVKGVSNLITVRPRPSAPDLKQRIERALERSATMHADRIDVEVNGGQVVLNGQVRSWAERQDAEHAAWQAPGVVSVDNRITIFS